MFIEFDNIKIYTEPLISYAKPFLIMSTDILNLLNDIVLLAVGSYTPVGVC